MRGLTQAIVLTALATTFANPAYAQLDRGRLTGAITDAQAAALPGVTVTVTSPALIGERTSISLIDGVYIVPNLPPGEYTISFGLSGFRTQRREGVLLALGQTLTINAQLTLAAVEETVTVSAESPIVDIQSTKIGTTFSTEKLTSLPTATDVWATLNMSPGVRMQGFDVGGSHKGQQSGFTVFGMSDQHKMIFDGVDASEGSSASGIYADFLSVQELAVTGAGADIEMPSAGVAVVSNYKSGGNTIKGLFSINYERRSFIGNNNNAQLSRLGFTGNPNLLFYEGHGELGGAIKRDKLWYFGSINRFKIDKLVSGIPREQGTDAGIFTALVTKETYRINDKHTAVVYYQQSNKFKPNRGLSATTPFELTFIQDSNSYVFKVENQSVWSSRLFTDVFWGRFASYFPQKPNANFRTRPPRLDLGTGQSSGAYVYSAESDDFRPQLKATLNYYVPEKFGSHEVKAGYEWQDDRAAYGQDGNSGPIQYLDLNGAPYLIQMFDVGAPGTFGTSWSGQDDRGHKNAVYVQDHWKVSSRLSITAGLRFERNAQETQGGHRRPVLTEIFPNLDVPGNKVLTRQFLTGRVGASYNLGDTGSTVAKAYFARFYDNTGHQFASDEDAAGDNSKEFAFLNTAGDGLYHGPRDLGVLVSTSGGAFTTVDRNIIIPHTDEMTLALEHQFWGESSVGISFVKKKVRNGYAYIRPAWEGAFTQPFTFDTQVQNYGTNTTTPVTFRLYDVPASVGVPNQLITNIAGDRASRDYDTLGIAFNKRVKRGLFLQASFDYEWNDSLKYPATFGGPTYTSEPFDGYSQVIQIRQDIPARQPTTSWQFRAQGRYEFPHEIAVALNLRTQGGFNYARLFPVAMPNAGFARFWGENLAANRSDDVKLVDLRLEKAFPFSVGHRLMVMVDVFNALNAAPVTGFIMNNGANYGKVTAAVEPRTAMIGARLEW